MKTPRFLKRCIIAALFLALLALLFTGVYYAFIKAPETCFDLKQNQDEQGVDCGGVCGVACKEVIVGEKFEIKELAFVPGGNNNYDILGKVYNPNDEAAASSFDYVFELRDVNGQVLSSRSGTSYMLPQETKSLIELNLESSAQPVTANLRISNVAWEKMSGYREKPNVNIYQKRYSQVSSGVGFGEAYGLLSNESPYDFRSIIVKVILRDASGKPLAFNTHRMDTVSTRESRDFKLLWPLPFPGVVERVDMEVDADVFHSENFMQQHFPGGSF